MFRGKAALPTHVLGVSSFEKAFFLRPAAPAPGGAGRSSSSGSSSSDGDSRTGEEEALHGRVLLGKGPLGDLLYPLYFKADVGPSVVPSEWARDELAVAAAPMCLQPCWCIPLCSAACLRAACVGTLAAT
jgi:hypothetical protein